MQITRFGAVPGGLLSNQVDEQNGDSACVLLGAGWSRGVEVVVWPDVGLD
jgi:hypothetical protein